MAYFDGGIKIEDMADPEPDSIGGTSTVDPEELKPFDPGFDAELHLDELPATCPFCGNTLYWSVPTIRKCFKCKLRFEAEKKWVVYARKENKV